MESGFVEKVYYKVYRQLQIEFLHLDHEQKSE